MLWQMGTQQMKRGLTIVLGFACLFSVWATCDGKLFIFLSLMDEGHFIAFLFCALRVLFGTQGASLRI